MTDCIFVAGLEVYCIIGLQTWERQVKQKLHIHLTLETDTRAAAASDTVADALDYRAVSKRVQELVEGSSFQLVEALAERIAATVLAEFPRASALTVRVEKPGAVRFSESVGVEIRRAREGGAR
ncbi:MAG: dihydroneopterin aldolase [Thermoanaerobaculales bacterium]